MTRPFDLSKFRKDITKSIEGLSIGFNDPTDWVSTGNYALNYLISSDFNKGVPLGKVTVFAGESGSGKSYICSGNLVRHAQEQGIFVVLIDSENALDEAWLHALGVDTSEEKLLKLNMAMIDDVAKTISEFMKSYKTLPQDGKPKVLFVIDSLGMLLTPTDVNQFEAGDMKGDMGRKPKALTSLVRNCVNMFGSHNVGLIATNHSYASQDMFDPDDKISGGQGFIYASSIVVAMRKLKLKEDEDGNKISEVRGIRATCKIMKTRYAKPFETVQIKIPYDQGMNPYSGLVDMFEADGLLTKEGNSLVYTTHDNQVIKKFRKGWERNDDGCLDIMMSEYGLAREPAATDEVVEQE
jgi:RecA/RadA recombinase